MRILGVWQFREQMWPIFRTCESNFCLTTFFFFLTRHVETRVFINIIVRENSKITILILAHCLPLGDPHHYDSDKEPGHVDANLRKTRLSSLLPNVSLTRFGECAVVRISRNREVWITEKSVA